MKFVDLHLHTNFSDGKYKPYELIELAEKKGFSAISITDHDTVNGIKQLGNKKFQAEIVPGVEMSTDYNGTEIHILGYFIDVCNKQINRSFDILLLGRKKRAEKIMEKLVKLGLKSNFKELETKIESGHYSRPDIAKLCVEKKFCDSVQEVFDKYININKPAYVPRFSFEPDKMIEVIHNAGGIAVWAHPKFSKNDKLIDYLVEKKVDGIEVFHSLHNKSEQKKYLEMAEKYNLIITGGSDYHGVPGIMPEIWEYKLSYEYLNKIKRKYNYV